MNVNNNTNYRLPLKWMQKIMDELQVNPTINVEYKNSIADGELNYQLEGLDGKKFSVDAYACDDSSINLFLGKWKKGKYVRHTSKYIKWLIAHELRHQYHFYNKGNYNYKFTGVEPEKIPRMEENDCTRYANKKVGRIKKDFKTCIL